MAGFADFLVDSLSPLKDRLKRLRIFSSPLLSDAGLSMIGQNFYKLESLSVSFFGAGGVGGNTKIKQATIMKLGSMPNLEHLELENMDVTPYWDQMHKEKLAKKIPSLSIRPAVRGGKKAAEAYF